MDLQYNLGYIHSWECGSRHDIPHFRYKYQDMDLYTFDWCKPNDWHIHCYWHTQVYNLVETLQTPGDKNKMGLR